MTLKQETAYIIEKFADKSLTFGCKFIAEDAYGDRTELIFLKKYYDTGNTVSIEYMPPGDSCCGVFNSEDCDFDEFEIIGQPVMIGYVLGRMETHVTLPGGASIVTKNSNILLFLWGKCGINKSLNEIFSGETDTQKYCQECLDGWHPRCAINKHDFKLKLKDPNAQALLEFIKTL